MTSMIQDYFSQIQNRRNNSNYRHLMTNIKADKPIGKLVRPNIFSLKNTFKQDVANMKYFVQGVQGKGNDYSVGKINDIAIKAGGLGIATMIASGVSSPFKKGMEFIGLSLWLAAMKFWPKLGVAYPIKKRTGVDLNLEYTDSANRRKLFYQDPQYICWDLMSDEEISAIGDKLKVPKNIKNRRSAIENKAKQVSIQGNTLILATSGFATPIIASLASDQVANKIFAPFLNKYNQIRSNSLIEKMLNEPSWIEDKITENKIDRIFSSKITPQDRQKLLNILDLKTDDQSLKKAIYKTVDNIFTGEDVKASYVELTEDLQTKIKDSLFKNGISSKASTKLNELFKSVDFKVEQNNISSFITQLETTLQENNLLTNTKKLKQGLTNIEELLYLNKTVEFSSVNNIKDKIKNVSKLLGSYDKKITKNLNKFLQYYRSSNTYLWETKPAEIIQTLGIKGEDLKALAVPSSDQQNNKILTKIMDNLANENEENISKVAKKLAKIFQTSTNTNKKQMDKALIYLDKLQNEFAQVCTANNTPELFEHFSRMFSRYRKSLINKYYSTQNTFATPLKTLNVFMQIKDKNIDKKAIKKIALSNIFADNYINKFDNFKNFIKNDTDYKQYADLLFGDINEKLAGAIDNPEIVKNINKSNQIMRTLFEGLTDNTNNRLNTKPVFSDILNKFKAINTRMLHNFDDFFDFEIKSKTELADLMKNKAKSNPEKMTELLSILNINPQKLEKGINLDTKILNSLTGTGGDGTGFLVSGKDKLKKILSFFDIKNPLELDNNFTLKNYLNNIDIQKARIGEVSKMEGRTFALLMNKSAINSSIYKTWFKRLGLSFATLCAITAFAVLRFGKKNEFNSDVYKKENN